MTAWLIDMAIVGIATAAFWITTVLVRATDRWGR